MKTWTKIVWSLWAMVVFYDGLSCQAGDEGERSRGGRKRNRGTGSGSGPGVSAFRPDPSSRNLPLPVDPLFTDQREIRLTFMKVLLTLPRLRVRSMVIGRRRKIENKY